MPVGRYARNGISEITEKAFSGYVPEESRDRIPSDYVLLGTRLGHSNWNQIGDVLESMLGSEIQCFSVGIEDKTQKDWELLVHVSKAIDPIGGR